jgi:superfamily II RNA helicase
MYSERPGVSPELKEALNAIFYRRDIDLIPAIDQARAEAEKLRQRDDTKVKECIDQEMVFYAAKWNSPYLPKIHNRASMDWFLRGAIAGDQQELLNQHVLKDVKKVSLDHMEMLTREDAKKVNPTFAELAIKSGYPAVTLASWASIEGRPEHVQKLLQYAPGQLDMYQKEKIDHVDKIDDVLIYANRRGMPELVDTVLVTGDRMFCPALKNRLESWKGPTGDQIRKLFKEHCA